MHPEHLRSLLRNSLLRSKTLGQLLARAAGAKTGGSIKSEHFLLSTDHSPSELPYPTLHLVSLRAPGPN
jgi:hypothetical protein